ncbi:hypothetical protein FOZ60_010374 [Perkinsus olseni]|uniref:Uncharacterized protein n=1 Tax=Perkinsus olseni TaxID=32597 RepID=A0A7J6PE98_PEROL|nr:hypothetical protein FOZ60_010374 [Perkinsus olseni]
MSAKQIIIGVSSAAAVLMSSNMPLGRATSVGAHPPGAILSDFPPLVDLKIKRFPRHGTFDARCFYGNVLASEENWNSSMEVRVWSEFSTENLVCPKAGKRKGFKAQFGWRALSGFQVHGEKRITFYDILPRNTGHDPIHNLGDSAFRQELGHLEKITKAYHDRYNEQHASFESLWRVCESLRGTMAKKYGKFDNMCDFYHDVTNKTAESVQKLSWKSEEFKDRIRISDRNAESWGEPF